MPIRFQVDADFYDHPKVLGMSDAAFALWVRAGSYSAAKLLDGFVSDDALSLFSTTQQEASGELVRRGLWKRVRGGYKFHQYGERNLTRARVEVERLADRERKQRQRQRPVDNGSSNGKDQVEAPLVPPGHPPDVRRDSERNPNRSVSVSVSESVSGSGQAAPSARASPPEPPRNCPEHLDNPDPPPCGRCADARRAHDRWEAQRAARIAAAPKCRRHRGQPADNCALCRAERLAPPEDAP